MKVFFSRRFTTITIAFIAIFFVLAIHFTEKDSQNKYNYYLQHQSQLFACSVENVVTVNEVFSNYIYDTINANEEIKKLLSNANKANEKRKPVIRSMLYSLFKDRYDLLSSKYHFQQVQFQLANGDSFLRFNNPRKYGDNLSAVRPTINISCKEHQYAKGFEGGRTFAGYRFVYPMKYQHNYIGSVEISLSPACVLKELYARNSRRDLGFILDRQAVFKHILTGEQYRYTASAIADGYVYDIDVAKFVKANAYTTLLYQDEDLVRKLRSAAADNLGKQESFSASFKHNKKIYLVHYCVVKDTADEPIGYFYSIYDDEGIETILHAKWNIMALIAIVTILLFLMVLLGKLKQDEISKIALTDQLTGVYNRYSFYEIAGRQMSKSGRNHQIISFGIIDIDHFKNINDTFGHLVGDEVLKQVAEIAKRSLRANDIFARFGGEEFIIMLPGATQQNAVIVLEKLRREIENYRFPKVKKVTISGGITEAINGEKFDDSIRRADEALYMAKQGGRNHVCAL